jgi:hypothetical protein
MKKLQIVGGKRRVNVWMGGGDNTLLWPGQSWRGNGQSLTGWVAFFRLLIAAMGNVLPHNRLNTNVGKLNSLQCRQGRGGVEPYIARIWPILLKTNAVKWWKISLFNIMIIISNKFRLGKMPLCHISAGKRANLAG